MRLPEAFCEMIHGLLGEEAQSFFDCFERERYGGIRINTLKLPKKRAEGLVKAFRLTGAVNWCSTGFYFPENVRPAKSPYYHAGLFYIQEPSAMLPASVAGIEPGMNVLDLCAAPGGKSTHVASLQQGRGILISNDISASRCKALVRNLETFGVRNAIVTNELPDRLATRFEGFFDRILIDAPCSGEGMFRKDPEAISKWEDHKPERCGQMQRELLYHAAKMLKQGGRIIYSTCTFEIAENEQMLAEFLSRNPEFEFVGIEHEILGISQGIKLDNAGDTDACGRIWPHRAKGEGHFVGIIEKRKNEKDITYADTVAPEKRGAKPKRITEIELFEDFCDEVFVQGKSFANNLRLTRIQERLYHIGVAGGLDAAVETDITHRLNGLRIVRNGWYLGEFKRNRFEPSLAFAMGLDAREVKRTVTVKPDDAALGIYLTGASFEIGEGAGIACTEDTDGSVLVCMDVDEMGVFPLGWGKRNGGMIKNKFPHART